MADGPEDNLIEDCLEALASLKGSFSSSTSYRSPAYPKSSDESAPPPKRQSSEAKKDTFQDTKIIVPTLTNPNHDDSTRSDRSFESHEVVFNTTGYTKPKLTNKPKSKQRPRSKSKPIDVPQSEYAIPSLMTILMSGSACSTSAPSSSSFLGDISLLRKTSLPPDFRDDAAANPTKTATKTALIAPTSSINPPPSATNPSSSSSSTGTHQRDRKRRYEWLSPYAYVKDPDARARIAELEGRLVEETQRRKVIEEEIRSKQSQNDLLSPKSLQNQLPQQQQQQTQGPQSQQQGFPLQIKPGQEFIPLAIWPRRISEQNPSEAGRIQLPVAAEAAAEAAAAAAVAAAATGTTVKAQNDTSGGGDAGQKKKRQYRRYNKKMFNSITDTDSVIQNTFVQKKQQEVIHQILQSKAGVNAATAGLIPGVKTSTNPIQQQQQQQQPPSNLMYDKDGDAIMAAASMTVPTKMNAVPSFGNSGSSVPASFMFPEPQQQQHQHQQQQQESPTTLLLPQIKKE